MGPFKIIGRSWQFVGAKLFFILLLLPNATSSKMKNYDSFILCFFISTRFEFKFKFVYSILEVSFYSEIIIKLLNYKIIKV
jgi:hypothetical protein